MPAPLFTQNIVACVWDFDRTLIPDYMQAPLFRRYNVDEDIFWTETNALAEHYRKRGYRVAPEIGYLNHILTYVLAGRMTGLNNKILFETGATLVFYPGIPEFFTRSKAWVAERAEYRKHGIQLEHYIVSTGLAQMIRGSKVAPYMEAIWGCEFIENPLQPGFLQQEELGLTADAEIAQIGMMIDNTTKTRALYEINKGTNRDPAIDVNARVRPEDRRVPFQNMLYIADGPSDIPCFAIVRENGGRTYAVHNPERADEFAQNDQLRKAGRIDHYGAADYTDGSATSNWLKLQIGEICGRIVADREQAVAQRTARPPRHLNGVVDPEDGRRLPPRQDSFLD